MYTFYQLFPIRLTYINFINDFNVLTKSDAAQCTSNRNCEIIFIQTSSFFLNGLA